MSDDPITEVWAAAKPLIEDGRIKGVMVRGLMDNGLRYKPQWAKRTIDAIKLMAERPPWPWQTRMQQLGLESISELALYDLLLAGGCEPKVAELRKKITSNAEFTAVIEKWEAKGWLEVKRTKDGKFSKVRATSQMPRILEPRDGPYTQTG
jgi:hypothetical protein